MNPDGGFYHLNNVMEYDDDSISFDVHNYQDENGMAYLDVVEDNVQENTQLS
jgi:hypothetical protein